MSILAVKNNLKGWAAARWPFAGLLKARARDFVAATNVNSLFNPSDTLLSVGCGKGYVEPLLNVKKVVGMDLDNRPVTGIEFVAGDARKLLFGDKSFDWVMFMFVLHHIPRQDQQKALQEAKRVARKGLIIVEDLPETPGLFDKLLNTELSGTHDFRNDEGWRQLFGQVGLKTEEDKLFEMRHLGVKLQHRFYVLK